MKKTIRKIIEFFVFLALGVLLLYLAFKGIDFNILLEDIKNAEYSWILLSFVFCISSHYARAYRWNLLIEPLGFNPRLQNSFYAVMIGYLSNFAIPRIGEIARCGALGRKEKIPVDSLIGTVIIERAFDLISLVILVFITVLIKIELFGTFLSQNIFKPLLNKAITSVDFGLLNWVIIIFILLVIAGIFYFLREKIATMAISQKIKKILQGVSTGIKTVLRMRKKWEFLFYTFAIWFMYLLMTYTMFYALPETAELKLVDGLFILIVGSFGIVAPVQNGLGAYHWFVTIGLTLFGITREKGLAFATISHGSQSVFIIFLGCLSLLMLYFSRRNSRIKQEQHG